MIDYTFSIQDLEFFLLIVTRVTCFVHTAVFFSTPNVPRRVKVGFSLLFSFLIFRFVVPHMVLDYSTVVGYAALVLKEATAGLLLGFSTNICMYILQFVGTVSDMDIGLSMMSLFDPISRTNTGFTGTMYQYAVLMILCITDMHHWIIRAFIESYELIPTGRAVFDSEKLLDSMIRFFSDYYSIGFRIFMPVFGVMLLLNAVLGIMAKIAPQMNMFSVGMQIKILVGLSVLFVTIGMLPSISDFIFSEMKVMFGRFAEGMYIQ
ncbi:MAG: flagellar biosynthetic protein FliR [Lachnospiraceae bacterium]|nr:flagellar biosynthetic protein FliR [Lachnospiraceae bacterium]